MKGVLLSVVMLLGINGSISGQLVQTDRYELEKKNEDDYFTVVSADAHGLVIFRDTEEYRRYEGDIWQVVGLDTALTERWEQELAIDERYIFKGYECADTRLFLLFSESESPSSDYYLVTIGIIDGKIIEHHIKNEIELELSHLIVVNNYLIMGGYVRLSPTLVSYNFGEDRVHVIPGFFKDRSDIIDLRANDNGTFNCLTLLKGYNGYHLNLSTHSPKGVILFEKDIRINNYQVLNGKSTGFVDGNIVVTGTFGNPSTYFAQGIYFAIVKPEGQDNIVKFYNFSQLEHFFDYMGPRRAARMKKRIDNRLAKGKEFRYTSRLILHKVQKHTNGYLLAAEIYNPQFEHIGSTIYPYGFGNNSIDYGTYSNTAHQRYVKRPGRYANIDNANHFEYLESVIVKLDENGELAWDNSFKVEKVESYSLEQVVDFNSSNEKISLLYSTEDGLNYKAIDASETIVKLQEPLMLKHEQDAVKHTFEGVGGTRHWYDDYFYVWGYHRIENKENPEVDNKRNVLYINKVMVKY